MCKSTVDFGYLHHVIIRKDGTRDSFCTELVQVKHLFADNWQAYFEGKWRKAVREFHKTNNHLSKG